MNKRPAALILSVALLLVAVPVLVCAATGEDWLSKGREETDPARQIECFTRAIRLNPELAEAYTLRGAAYNDQGKYEKAVGDYTQAMKLNPDNAQTYNNRGWAYEKLGQYNKAVADYTAAIRIDPHYSSAYNNRGVAYYNMGKVSEALADFNKACTLGYATGCENYYKIK